MMLEIMSWLCLVRANQRFPVQPLRKKYFPSPQTQITGLSTAVPLLQRGVSRSSRTWGGTRWTRVALLTNGADADGEAVWS
jgi:hypothetical protein